MNDYVTWNRDQKKQFDQQLQEILSWHQREELPRYSRLLAQIKQDFDQPLSGEVLYQHIEEVTELWLRLLVKIEPAAVLLLATLSDDQVIAMRENLERNAAKLEKKYILRDNKEIHKKRIKKVEKWVSGLIGRLSKQQKQLIVKWDLRLEDSSSEWLLNRKRWTEEFDLALQQRHRDDFAKRINRLFVHPQTLWSDEYRQMMTFNTEQGVALIIALQKSLSDQQRQRLCKELQQWVQLFDELAAEAALPE